MQPAQPTTGDVGAMVPLGWCQRRGKRKQRGKHGVRRPSTAPTPRFRHSKPVSEKWVRVIGSRNVYEEANVHCFAKGSKKCIENTLLRVEGVAALARTLAHPRPTPVDLRHRRRARDADWPDPPGSSGPRLDRQLGASGWVVHTWLVRIGTANPKAAFNSVDLVAGQGSDDVKGTRM